VVFVHLRNHYSGNIQAALHPGTARPFQQQDH